MGMRRIWISSKIPAKDTQLTEGVKICTNCPGKQDGILRNDSNHRSITRWCGNVGKQEEKQMVPNDVKEGLMLTSVSWGPTIECRCHQFWLTQNVIQRAWATLPSATYTAVHQDKEHSKGQSKYIYKSVLFDFRQRHTRAASDLTVDFPAPWKMEPMKTWGWKSIRP